MGINRHHIRLPLLLMGLVLISILIWKGGLVSGLGLLVLAPALIFLVVSFRNPMLFLLAVLMMSFLVAGLSRYISGIPFGLTVDGFLVLGLLALLFSKEVVFDKKSMFNLYTGSLIVWLLFTLIQIANPIAPSLTAWFYANRGLSFYPLLIAILVFYLVKKPEHIHYFVWVWAIFSLLGSIWGIKQYFFGVTSVEQAWLNAGAASTHVLFGKLRVFSYYSDAAQFGASQSHTCLSFAILALFKGKMRWRYAYILISILAFYSLLISGSRGPLAILAIGGFAYLIMSRNFKIVFVGLAVGVGAFVFLKYTTILQSNYQVQRLRSALDADDPSLRVRLEREKLLKVYLADKPMGGGIGSAGYWGKRFSPGTFLAELGTDGHYTRIWMETGVVGLVLYGTMLAVILIYLGVLLWKLQDGPLRQFLLAFYCGFVGICVASYSNGLLTQMPTGSLVFTGLTICYLGGTGRIALDD